MFKQPHRIRPIFPDVNTTPAGGDAADYRTNPERPEQRRGGDATVGEYGELHQAGHVAGMGQRHADPSPIGARSKLDALTKRRVTMKTVISVGMAFALMLSVAPAMAGETETFRAFSSMAAREQARLTALTDAQLAAIEGEGSGFSQSALNYAAVYQANVNSSAFSSVDQRNSAHVRQSIIQSSTDAKPAPVAPPTVQPQPRPRSVPQPAQRARTTAR
jgi:hypothetical protein